MKINIKKKKISNRILSYFIINIWLIVKFKEKNTKGTKSLFFTSEHNGKKLILKSDLSVKEAGISIRPDIFIGIQEDENMIRLIAIFEIKLPQSEKSINKLKERFK